LYTKLFHNFGTRTFFDVANGMSYTKVLLGNRKSLYIFTVKICVLHIKFVLKMF